MKDSLKPGVSKVRRVIVDRDRTVAFMGEQGRVYATPELCRDIEHTCREALLEHVSPEEDSVGIEIMVRHSAPTLPGMEVSITATVINVEGRKVSFDVVATDELEPIGTGKHVRFIVDREKTYERLRAKAAKRAARSN
ncbi:MAG TPA: thioesterase family protein [Bradyrhizobium sp.]|jgi:fluoroacetyl-CoA thioesterase|nr:thioesterase family protein [Bradyrhizobium sp.]